jgi:AcrR family transcriptional regulator
MSDDNALLMPGDSRNTRADAVKNHALILDTARTLFNQHGVESVSMSQVARDAGVGKGTLYRHFSNKTDLCYALLEEDQRDLQEATLRRLRQMNPPLDDLRWFLERAARFVLDNLDLLAEGANVRDVYALELRAHLWWRQTIRGLLHKAGLNDDIDYMTDVLYVMLNINTLRYQRMTRGYSPDRIIAGLINTLTRLTAGHCNGT